MKDARVAAAAALGVVLAATGASLITAAEPRDTLPPEKQALVDYAESRRREGKPADKNKGPAGPLVVQEDGPPDSGLLGAAGAPIAGGVFTPQNAWAGWVSPTTFVQVYAGAPGEDAGRGLVFVVRRPGHDGRLDPDAQPEVALVPAPLAGGPLRIVRIDGSTLIVANPAGREFRFQPASGRFD